VTAATSTASTVRREELAQFLRSRRARLTPSAVGLPPGIRRRTPGLRREEVAQLAGVGVTWYTWLEQGRPINASVQILDAIARTLRLDRAEREHLYHLADVPQVPEADTTAPLPGEVQQILDQLVPVPAAVYNGKYDVLAWNDAYAWLFPEVNVWPAAERNALWQLFTTPDCCACIVNKSAELPQMVATFRAAFGRHVGEPAWTGFVQRLSQVSDDFARMWATHDVAGPGVRTKMFQNVAGGLLRTVATSLAISAAPEARMVVYTPVSAADRALLEKVAGDPPATRRCALHRVEGIAAVPERALVPVG
jgi:transcriptional regulator with XRE-family HTH domain